MSMVTEEEMRVRELLELYSVEEALEVMDITPEEAILVLLSQGYVTLPDFLNRQD